LKRVQARKRTIEQRAMSWLRETQKVLICGHTHYPRCAAPGEQAYFNTGSCVVSGYITGLELEKGQISLVQWSLGKQGAPIERKLLAPPRSLSHLN
jgi:predicted phosphodiesterase